MCSLCAKVLKKPTLRARDRGILQRSFALREALACGIAAQRTHHTQECLASRNECFAVSRLRRHVLTEFASTNHTSCRVSHVSHITRHLKRMYRRVRF